MAGQEREALRRQRWVDWIEEPTDKAETLQRTGVVLAMIAVAIGLPLYWLFASWYVLYIGIAFGIGFVFSASMDKAEISRRRFFLAAITPVENAVGRIEERVRLARVGDREWVDTILQKFQQ